jgi:cytochrome c biogenesis protein CcmG/thiol:disulfide interchange protein DsbE
MTFLTHRPIAALACALALALGVSCSTSKAPPARSIEAPRPAPEFSIQDLDGNTIDHASLKGKIVVINFWAVWSPSCAREIPDLVQIRESFGKDKDRIAIVGICLESKNLSDIKSFATQLGINYPISIQENNFADQFGGIDAIPSTFVIDPGWNLVNRYTGKVLREELRYELQYMLDEFSTKEKAAHN